MSAINPTSAVSFVNDLKEMASGKESNPAGESFSAFLGKSINQVNDMMKIADAKSTEMAIGKTENLHDTMISIEKAETSLKLMTQVRNKVIDAYHEVMRMQL